MLKRGGSLLFSLVVLYIGGWQPIWKVTPSDILQLALQGNVLRDSQLSPSGVLPPGLLSPATTSEDDQTSEQLIGNYFISSGGLAILVNDNYYGAEITNRFFDSIALSWIALFFALSASGFGFFIIF